jgi:tetratricopeptide (TPR) repeat protein
LLVISMVGQPQVGAAPDIAIGQQALRDGRFEVARVEFDRIASSANGAPEGPFFQAFLDWWKLLDHPRGNAELRLGMEDHLAEAAARAKQLVESSTNEQERERGLVYTGVSLLLAAQSRAVRGAHLASASAARQGHKALTEALKQDPDSADALFAMGAYNYYADNLPLLVKGLRFFLFIPGGDEARGIAQLETAGQRSDLFGTESLMLLAHIFSGGYESDYRRALGYLEKAAARHPSSPLIRLAYADLLYKLGRLRDAASQADAALGAVRSGAGYTADLGGLAFYQIAACRLAQRDPLRSLDFIDDAMQASPPRSPQDTKKWLALLADASEEAGRPQRLERWRRLLAQGASPEDPNGSVEATPSVDPIAAARAEALASLAAGRVEEARGRLEDLLKRSPSDPRLHYDLGRLLQRQGRWEEARPHLRAAAEAPVPPVAGWAWLRLGWELEHEGRRDRALPFYKRAAELKGFSFKPAAKDLLAYPAPGEPEG